MLSKVAPRDKIRVLILYNFGDLGEIRYDDRERISLRDRGMTMSIGGHAHRLNAGGLVDDRVTTVKVYNS